MGTGKVSQIDDELLGILNQAPDITGPVHFGEQVVETEADFLTLSTLQTDDQLADYTLRFIEVVVPSILDSREDAPIKTTSRTHTFTINLYVNYENIESFFLMRKVTETVMDLLNNNWRPHRIVQDSPIISITPADVNINLELLDNNYQIYRSEITIQIEEYVAHV